MVACRPEPADVARGPVDGPRGGALKRGAARAGREPAPSRRRLSGPCRERRSGRTRAGSGRRGRAAARPHRPARRHGDRDKHARPVAGRHHLPAPRWSRGGARGVERAGCGAASRRNGAAGRARRRNVRHRGRQAARLALAERHVLAGRRRHDPDRGACARCAWHARATTRWPSPSPRSARSSPLAGRPISCCARRRSCSCASARSTPPRPHQRLDDRHHARHRRRAGGEPAPSDPPRIGPRAGLGLRRGAATRRGAAARRARLARDRPRRAVAGERGVAPRHGRARRGLRGPVRALARRPVRAHLDGLDLPRHRRHGQPAGATGTRTSTCMRCASTARSTSACRRNSASTTTSRPRRI